MDVQADWAFVEREVGREDLLVGLFPAILQSRGIEHIKRFWNIFDSRMILLTTD